MKLGGSLLIALVLGFGSAWLAINTGLGGSTANGPWMTDPTIGSTDAGAYRRAAVARAGFLALDKSETLYFTASEDDEGAPLTSNCTYRLTGSALPTRWWSITLYGPDHYLVANAENLYSQSMNSVAFDAEGQFSFAVGPGLSGSDIPTGFAGDGEGSRFSLTMRFYNPEEDIYDRLTEIALPAIAKEACS